MDKTIFFRYNTLYVCGMQKAGGFMRHRKSVMRSMMMVTQLGLSVMVPVFVCILAGSWLDRHAGTNLTFFFLVLGFLAGGLSGYRMAKATLRMNEREEQREDLSMSSKRKETVSPPVHRPKQTSRVRNQEDKSKFS